MSTVTNSRHLLKTFVSWQDLVAIGTGDANGDRFGVDVALSGDANTMAVGADQADPDGAGIVRLYGRDGTDWNMFQQINGPAGSSFLVIHWIYLTTARRWLLVRNALCTFTN